MPEQFGCCSSYRVCSKLGNCIKRDNPDYDCCGYRKNLEAGRVFYNVSSKKPIGITVRIGSHTFFTGREESGQWFSRLASQEERSALINISAPSNPARMIEKYYAVPVPKPNVLLQDKKQVVGQMNIFELMGG